MLLKTLLLPLLLGAFSVTALPNPEAKDVGLEERDIGDDLIARGYCPKGTEERYGKCVCTKDGYKYDDYSKTCKPDCGDDAYWKYGKCRCKKDGYKYDDYSKTCKPDCGDDAYWKHGKCHCKKKGQEYHKYNKKCRCPKGKKWNPYRQECKRGSHRYDDD
ncbi:hypothetical protein B0J13DRAFT_621910 [Dactylonectria estremocensis]|uniref:Uncharacterized protein n=1 Tax=Dactylonectria estremocensis TaxID=1079267 RepID=A0A9P9J746_9HYPO|nr:hypothetical protein B0J13DRAFT_621910 [Dactylonectria estremocensis]